MGLGVFGTFRTGGNSFLCFYFDAAFVLRCLRRRRRRHLSLMRVASCFDAPCIQCGIFSICRKLGFQQKNRGNKRQSGGGVLTTAAAAV